MTTRKDWHVYGSTPILPAEREARWLATAPPWREPRAEVLVDRDPPGWSPKERRGERYVDIGEELTLDLINTALLLRRPMLLSGPPGIGKSSLAYAIAWRLGLGPPLRWEIGSRTTLEDALYTYDAVGHLGALRAAEVQSKGSGELSIPDTGHFITLGPLGTALLPTRLPRVLLIDELDKASYDLPNDLLHVLEEASFVIPELVRLSTTNKVYPYDRRSEDDMVPVPRGFVEAYHHPVVVITTNTEREFAPAFLRRCVQIPWRTQDAEKALPEIVRGWFADRAEDAPALFEELRRSKMGLRVSRPDLVLQSVGLLGAGVSLEDLQHIIESLERADR